MEDWITNLYGRIIERNRRAISKAISIVENEDFDYLEFLSLFAQNRKNSEVIGITGPPGVGKSTLIARLIQYFKKGNDTVGIIMVDPTSPISGGAILGDRLRLNEFSDDKEVFIRSMASRGKLGGLSYGTFDAIDILATANFKTIIVESVGIGQQEIDLKDCVDLLILVLSPESGDFIQAMKAGVIEVADIIVINKSDREGADLIFKDIEEIMSFKKNSIPILQVSAVMNENIEQLYSNIKNLLQQHKDKIKFIKENIRKRIYNFVEKVILRKLNNSQKLKKRIELITDSIVAKNTHKIKINDLISIFTNELL